MVVELVFAMLMIQNGNTIEYVPTEGMTDCLKQKRVVARSIGEEQEGIYIPVSYTHQTLPTMMSV